MTKKRSGTLANLKNDGIACSSLFFYFILNQVKELLYSLRERYSPGT
jgi:hypothetical protein